MHFMNLEAKIPAGWVNKKDKQLAYNALPPHSPGDNELLFLRGTTSKNEFTHISQLKGKIYLNFEYIFYIQFFSKKYYGKIF